MSYKALNDTRKRAALMPFLEAANSIHGLLLTVAVHRELNEFKLNNTRFSAWRSRYLSGNWKKRTFEKAMAVSALFAIGVSGYSDESMSVTWLTDNDAIAQNSAKQEDLLKMACSQISAMATSPPSRIRIQLPGTTELPRLVAEDLLSIPDLAAGCLADTINKHFLKNGVLDVFDDFVIADQFEKEKDELITRWLTKTGEPLKKMTVAFYPPGDGVGNMDVRILPVYGNVGAYTEIDRAPAIGRIYKQRDYLNLIAG